MGLCLIWLRIIIFSVGVNLHYFVNFRKFNITATAAHYSIIQKEVDELLAKGAIEPSNGGASFYSKHIRFS